MKRRLLAVAASAVLMGLGAAPAPAEGAVLAAKKWCMTYCDAIHLGCQKTIGWFDDNACEEWHEGCLDGCRVNQG